jgi:hypothetical protein
MSHSPVLSTDSVVADIFFKVSTAHSSLRYSASPADVTTKVMGDGNGRDSKRWRNGNNTAPALALAPAVTVSRQPNICFARAAKDIDSPNVLRLRKKLQNFTRVLFSAYNITGTHASQPMI